jgi:hypothetical protein
MLAVRDVNERSHLRCFMHKDTQKSRKIHDAILRGEALKVNLPG